MTPVAPRVKVPHLPYLTSLTIMNKHILLVMKWLNDKSSVTIEELKNNRKEAYADADAAAWVSKYFKRTGENRQDYIDGLAPKVPAAGQQLTHLSEVITFIGLAPSGNWVCQGEDGSFGSYKASQCKPVSSVEDKLNDVLRGVDGLLESLDIPVTDISSAIIKAGYHL